MGRFEQEPGRLKPLLGEALSSFAALKCLQHGKVGRYCIVLKPEAARNGIKVGRYCIMLTPEI